MSSRSALGMVLVGLSLLFGGACSARAQEVVSAAVIAQVKLQDHVGRDWSRTMIDREVAVPAGVLREPVISVVGPSGEREVAQLAVTARHPDGSVARGRAWFMAELKPQAQVVYQIVAGPRANSDDAMPQVFTDAQHVTLQNKLVALRLPAQGQRTYASPRKMSQDHFALMKQLHDESQALGPIRGIRLSDGRWTGGSYFFAADPGKAPQVLGESVQITQRGPLFVEACVSYQLSGGASYQCWVRVRRDDPGVEVSEQYDLKQIGDPGIAMVRFVLTGGMTEKSWRPDTFYWMKNPFGATIADARTPAGQFIKSLFPGGLDVRSFGSTAIDYRKDTTRQLTLEPWLWWGDLVTLAAIVDGKDLLKSAGNPGEFKPVTAPMAPPVNVPFLAVVPVHAGSWRLDGPGSDKVIFATEAGDVTMSLPLGAGAHPSNILHTGEWDPTIPYTHGRRFWTLVAGNAQGFDRLIHYRLNEGYIPLNEYKDWNLDWQQDVSVQYPRLVFGPEELTRLKANLESHPFANELRETIYVSDKPQRVAELLRHVDNTYRSLATQYTETNFQRFRQSQEVLPLIGALDELLASQQLDAATRQRLRRQVAVLAYLVSSPDFNPRGSMVHLGNPNMGMNRAMALPMLAAMIPDHPMARRWMEISAQELKLQLAKNTSPGGGWSEVLTYYEAGANHLVQAAIILRHAGLIDDATARQALQVGMFPLNFMMPPHAQFGGARMIPMFGHEGWEVNNHWIVTAVLASRLDPVAARAAYWAWSQQGKPTEFRHNGLVVQAMVLADRALMDAAPKLESTWVPGVGVTMRAHAGDARETTLLYRTGYCISHADSEQHSFVLWGRGAPLATMSMFGYALHQQPPYIELARKQGWHSRPKWADQSAGDWDPTVELQSAHFSAVADALRAGWVNGYRQWDRQMLMVKGRTPDEPTYVLFRESQKPTYRPTPMHWVIRTAGPTSTIQKNSNGMTYTSAMGAQLDVQFVVPAQVESNSEEASTVSAFGDPTKIALWKQGGGAINGASRFTIQVPETLTVTQFGPFAPSQDVIGIMQPRSSEEARVQARSLGAGLVEVKFGATRDLIFVAAQPTTARNGDFEFEGTLAMVRRVGDEFDIVIAEASPSRPAMVRLGAVTIRAMQPTTQKMKLSDLEMKREIVIESPNKAISCDLDPKLGAIEQVEQRVQRQRSGSITRYRFDSPVTSTIKTDDGITFVGRRGSVEIDSARSTVRFIMLAGSSLQHAGSGAAVSGIGLGGDGPWDVSFHRDHIEGRSDGQARVLRMQRPAGMSATTYLVLGDTPYAPGLAENELVVPLPAGPQKFQLVNMTAPEVFPAPVQPGWGTNGP